MADISPQAFYNRTYGKMFDVDGFPAYNKYQCWDGMAECCRANNVPLAVIYCGNTGYAQDIWDRRKYSNILNYFDEVEAPDFKNGDWVIFPFSYHMTPKSHVCMYWNGQAYGQNQGGKKYFNLADWLDFNYALGGFRLKQWETVNTLRIGSGSVLYDQFAGQDIQIRGFADGHKITLISAKTNGKVNGNDVQLIENIDDADHVYYSKLNANRWIMSTGQALGVRCGVNEWNVPRQGAFYYYALKKDGTTEIGLDRDFWYTPLEVEFACSPDVILMYHGQDKMLYSPEVVGTKERANVQSLLIRTKERFATALVKGRLTPAQCLAWAKSIDGIQDVVMMDSGGSSCQQIGYAVTYATPEHRKISNAIAEYSYKLKAVKTDEAPVAEPVLEPIEEPKEANEEVIAETEERPVLPLSGGGSGQYAVTRQKGMNMTLNNKTYDVLKWLCLICLPALAFFVAQYGDILGMNNPDVISKLINGVATLLGTLIGVSTAAYNRGSNNE